MPDLRLISNQAWCDFILIGFPIIKSYLLNFTILFQEVDIANLVHGWSVFAVMCCRDIET